MQILSRSNFDCSVNHALKVVVYLQMVICQRPHPILQEIEEKKTDESSEGVSTDKVVSSGAVSENCTDSKRSKCESERTKECSDVAVPTAGETLAKDEAKKIVDAFTKDNGNCEWLLEH